MKVFILPSWCPTRNNPLSGTFFLEQAHALARARPDWTVAICLFDLEMSRLPWRLMQIPQFVKNFIDTPRLQHHKATSGLHVYRVWIPFLPKIWGSERKRVANAAELARQAKMALHDFVANFGKPDILHSHAVYPGGSAAAALGKAYDIPIGLTEHLGPFPPPTLYLSDGQIMRFVTDTYARATLCSAVSQSLANRIKELGLADDITVIPNFLADEYGSLTGNRPASHEGFSLLSAGGPSFAKGTDVLLKALAFTGENVSLRLAGSSAELPIFRDMADSLGLANRVTWLGSLPRDEMLGEFSACDAFVLPSQSETFGVSLIEAMAYGKPVIATKSGGPEDIVNSFNGILVPVGDIRALAAAIGQMRSNRDHYRPEMIRADFLARFSATAVVEQLAQWYAKIIFRKDLQNRSS